MAQIGAVMTLPGIAGFILTIGMGVDSNVLIFERIKEELAAGKGARAAVAAGFDRVFLTILDTHVASLISAAFLFQFGTGPIRGFATTLFFGLLSNVFTAVFVSRTLFELILSRRQSPRRFSDAEHLEPASRDLCAFSRTPITTSSAGAGTRSPCRLVVILAGIGLMVQRGVPLGIDFSGGTIVILKFQKATSENDVRRALDSVPGEEVIQAYGDPAQNQILVRLPLMEGAEQGASLEAGREAGGRRGEGGEPRAVRGRRTRSSSAPSSAPTCSARASTRRSRRFSASRSTSRFRFRFSFAVGAMAATLHDILVTLAFLIFFGYELSLNVIAAILTITGYSVNDTIVIFDRVRENSHLMRRESLVKIVNDSVNQTLSRTVITAGTTFLSVLSLYLFGGEVLDGFAFTMLVGIVSGTYSTIFIAAAVAIILSKAAPVRTAPAAAPTPGSGKAGRKAKAS